MGRPVAASLINPCRTKRWRAKAHGRESVHVDSPLVRVKPAHRGGHTVGPPRPSTTILPRAISACPPGRPRCPALNRASSNGSSSARNAVPRNGNVRVGLVLDIFEAPLPQSSRAVLRAAFEERPNDAAVLCVHRGQTSRPGAAKQPQQIGFGLIVTRVPRVR
jgi:hypothetical protein